MKLLMIEDNKSVSEMMSMFFRKEKWDVEYAYDGLEAIDIFKKDPESWDMITLDLNLPGMDGLQVNAELRKISPTVPIIILTARDSESDQVLGLEMGADDYIVKPFSPITLIARIKALHRLSGKPINDLTPKEFDLLKTLAQKPRQVFSRDQLLQLVWDYEYYGDERTVDAHIKKLRQKIEKAGPQVIQTVWGVGYKFDDSGVADK